MNGEMLIEVNGRQFESLAEFIKDYETLSSAFKYVTDENAVLKEALQKVIHYVEVRDNFDSIKEVLK